MVQVWSKLLHFLQGIPVAKQDDLKYYATEGEYIRCATTWIVTGRFGGEVFGSTTLTALSDAVSDI